SSWYRCSSTAAGGLAAPLDDAFIYLQYGHRFAEGHPFEYSPGAGFSTGATSILYPMLLALGHALRFTGDRLIGFAYVLASAGLIASVLIAYWTVRPRYGAGAALAAGLLIAFSGWIAWGYLSMMEIWLHGTLLIATAFFLSRTSHDRRAWPLAMSSAALLALARPEAMIAGFAAAGLGLLARWRGRGEPASTDPLNPVWAVLPVIAVAVFFLINLAGSGDVTTNTFQAKSVLAQPYLSLLEKAGQIGENVVGNGQALFESFGFAALGVVLFALAAIAVAAGLPREWREREVGPTTAVAVLLAAQVLASSQAGRPAIHERYLIAAAPLAAVLAVIGLWELGGLIRAPAGSRQVAAGVLIIAVLPGLFSWASTYGENSAEHYLQQRRVRFWLHENTPEDTLIAINDAGAIPYYSGRKVIDLVGLVSNDFARWNRQGPGSEFEAVERMPEDERPAYFAVYPWWFGWVLLAVEFDTLYEAHLPDHQIVGGDTAVVLQADYAAVGTGDVPPGLRDGDVIDEVDIADLTSEDEHGYEASALQAGVEPERAQDVRRLQVPGPQTSIIDGGRVISGNERFSFNSEADEALVLRGRFFCAELTCDLRVKANGRDAGTFPLSSTATEWSEAELTIPAELNTSDRLRIEISMDTQAEYESYHYWLYRPR
ncbi:MAG: hypothetical protein U1B78_04360, partial [Dehalococcoidia bacterium]|nr:hypothetical protein [Dehalococcoidia bacterium]